MANGFFLTSAVIQGMLGSTGLTEAIDAGTAAVIEIYSGTAPADADAAITGTLLATVTCSAVAFSGIAYSSPNAVATFAAITSGTAVATGTASHFRIKTAVAGTVIGQGTVGAGGTFDLVLNTVAITSGSTVSVTSGTISLPKG